MAENSQIEWTDHTFNPCIGCAKVHAGCLNCYAERDAANRRGLAQWGMNGTRVLTSRSTWANPVAWNRKARETGSRHLVFCASLADVFEDWGEPMMMRVDGKDPRNVKPAAKCASCSRLMVYHGADGSDCAPCLFCRGPVYRYFMADARDDLFSLIDATPDLIWLALTKRPENVRSFWPVKRWASQAAADSINEIGELARSNVFLGTSPADDNSARQSITALRDAKKLAAGLFLSCEPLLGRLQFRGLWNDDYFDPDFGVAIDWVIVGGESGPNARPCDVGDVESVVDQCQSAGVPVFVKQLGAVVRAPASVGERWGWRRVPHVSNVGDIAQWRPRHHKGADLNEWPESLRVRQFPAMFGKG